MADSDSRDGVRYAGKRELEFVDGLHAVHDAALAAAFDAPAQEGMPAIQVGRSEGKFLELLARLCGARKIVEVGTLAGYSAIRLARGLAEDGRLWTIESDSKHADVARGHIESAGFGDRVEVIVGRAVDVLPTLTASGPFDLVFVDADKENYPAYGRWACDNLRQGGLLVGDNAYLFGQLLGGDARAEAMRLFHEQAASSFDTVCLPTPDGMLIGLKR